MKTTFLLHGGRLKLPDKRNDTYFQELTKKLKDGDVLLWVGFARETDVEEQEAFDREKALIMAQAKTNINVIKAELDQFLTQLTKAEAVHITGGESPILSRAISGYPDFVRRLDGKLVGGSSAGACLFATYFLESGKVMKGLGVFPIRLMVHYGNPEFYAAKENLKLLQTLDSTLELVTIEECAWIAREADL